MTRMPDIETEAARAVGWVEHHLPHRHAAPQSPAPQPVTMAPATADATAPQKDTTMSLATLEDDVKNDLTQGLDYLEGMVGRLKTAAPGIIGNAETVLAPIVERFAQTVGDRVLPPLMEEGLMAVVDAYFAKLGQPAQPVAAQPQQPVPAGQ